MNSNGVHKVCLTVSSARVISVGIFSYKIIVLSRYAILDQGYKKTKQNKVRIKMRIFK